MTNAPAPLPTLRIRTSNSAYDQAGSIHDDAKAQAMGYAGGFVPGPTVFGYMLRLMAETYGEAWLAGGEFEGRLRRPTYAGYEVSVEGEVVATSTDDSAVTVELRVLDPDGAVTATGTALCRPH